VILIDVNLLLYASIESFEEHERTRTWLDRQLAGPSRVGLPWASLLGYVRIATNTRLFSPKIEMNSAWERVCEWLAARPAWIPQPTDRHSDILGELLLLPGMYSNLVPDAHLAALAIEHGLTLCSTDSDFARFPGLRWHDPLSAT
jgi:toxin-antitoxin system PIN domain toxin